MILVTITAILAVCSADKLDRTYLPPPSAQSAGGSPGSLKTPFETKSFNQGLGGIPQGGFSNENDGVVVEAAAAGTRSSELSGLGAPRVNYGSFNSKVGEAAFKVAPQQQSFGGSSEAQSAINQQNLGQGSFPSSNTRQEFGQSNFQGFSSAPQKPERAQATADRAAGTIKFESAVEADKFNYAFETENGISAEQNGMDSNGIQAQGGFSYTGDDGQVYSVTYTADEGGYKPQGSHLPTAPPIPEEILKSLEKNAQDEAAGIVDDGSYDAQKYNVGGEYTESENNSGKYKGQDVFGNRREPAATASGSFNRNTFAHPVLSAQSSGFGVNSESGISNQINPTLNNLRPPSEYSEQSDQLSGVSNEKPYLNNKPMTSFRPQAPAFNSAAQLILQKSKQNSQESSSIDNAGSLNAKPNINAPAFGSYNGISLQQNLGNRDPGSSPKTTFNTASNSLSSNSNEPKIQYTSKGPSFHNEYLPPSNSFQFNANKLQISQSDVPRFSSQGGPSQNFALSSTSNQPSRQPSQLNSFQQNSASIQTEKISNYGRPINSNSLSQNIYHRLNYEQPTSQPDSKLMTPVEPSSSFPSYSGQSLLNVQNSRPINFNPKTQISQYPSGFSSLEVSTPNNQNSKKESSDFPSTLTSSASASASLDLQATYPTFKQKDSFNQQQISSTYQFNQNTQTVGKPSVAFEDSFNKFSQNQVSSTALPSFSQSLQYQDKNDAYYYNQPGQPFITPSQNRPSVPSNQFNNIPQRTPFSTTNQNIQSNGFLNQGPSTTVTYPSPQTAAPTVPTSATQNDLGLNQVSQFSGITQATASSFLSNVPSQSFENQPSTQQSLLQNTRFPAQPSRLSFEQSPTSAIPSFLQQSQNTPNVPLNERPVTTQQYTGELYQYNKPPEVSSAPDAQSDSEENLKFQSSPSKVESSMGGYQTQFALKPVFNQQSKGEIYDYKKPPQVFLASAETEKQEPNASSKAESPISEVQTQFAPQPQFGQVSQQSKPTNAKSEISQNKGSDGSSIRPICCKPTTSQTGSFSSSAMSSFASQSTPGAIGFQGTQNLNQNLLGRGEVFSESRKPPSYDPETGYHY